MRSVSGVFLPPAPLWATALQGLAPVSLLAAIFVVFIFVPNVHIHAASFGPETLH